MFWWIKLYKKEGHLQSEFINCSVLAVATDFCQERKKNVQDVIICTNLYNAYRRQNNKFMSKI
jgi:hypothetical protein